MSTTASTSTTRKAPHSRRGWRSRLPWVIGGVAASALALAACAPAGGDSGPVELRYAIWDEAQAPATQQLIDNFEALHPDVTVSLEVAPSQQYWTKIQAQATGDTLPDVFWMSADHFTVYASNGQLLPIDDLVDSGDIDLANYPSSVVDLYNLDGTQYGAPRDFDTIAVYYNKDLFESAGVALPEDSWTWADFQAAAKALSDAHASEGVYGVVTEMGGGQESYYNTIFEAGGEVISADKKKSGFDSPEAIEGLQFWTDLIANGSMPTMAQLSDTPAEQWFMSGKAAMYWSGSWMAGPLRDSDVGAATDVVALPTGKIKTSVLHGLSNVIAANTKHAEAAQQFVTYLAGEDAAKVLADSGAVIPAFNGTQTAWVDSVPSMHLQVFLDTAESAQPFPVSLNTPAWQQELEPALLPDAFSGARPVAEVAHELADKMNALLAQE